MKEMGKPTRRIQAQSGESPNQCERLQRQRQGKGSVSALTLTFESSSPFFVVHFSVLTEMAEDCGKEVVTVVRDDFFHDPFFKVSKLKESRDQHRYVVP